MAPWQEQCRAWLLVVVVGGCTFDSSGADDGANAATTTHGTGSSTAELTSDPGTEGTTSSHGTAQLEIIEAPIYDYGTVELGTATIHPLVVRNGGSGVAIELEPSVEAPFAAAPGTRDTCTTALPPGEECTVSVIFAPTEVGATQRRFAIRYDDGGGQADAACTLRGEGVASNLIVNGDAEDVSEPPTGWTDVVGGEWRTATESESDMPPHTGNRAIWAGRVDSAALIQDIDLTPYSAAIERGGLGFDFEMWMRSFSLDEDRVLATLEYRDAGGNRLELFDTDWHILDDWESYLDRRTPMVGATHVRVRLECERIAGDDCDGVFDDLALRAVFP